MAIGYLLQTPCTITQRTASSTLDEYGQPAPPTVTTVATKCWLDQGATSEETAGIEAVRTDARIYLPAETVIDANDRISVEDQGEWEVVGQPNKLIWPNRTPSHIEADCRKVNT